MVSMGATIRDGEEHYSPEGSRRTLMIQSKKSSSFGLSQKFKHSKVNQSVDVTGNQYFSKDIDSSINFGQMMGSRNDEG